MELFFWKCKNQNRRLFLLDLHHWGKNWDHSQNLQDNWQLFDGLKLCVMFLLRFLKNWTEFDIGNSFNRFHKKSSVSRKILSSPYKIDGIRCSPKFLKILQQLDVLCINLIRLQKVPNPSKSGFWVIVKIVSFFCKKKGMIQHDGPIPVVFFKESKKKLTRI